MHTEIEKVEIYSSSGRLLTVFKTDQKLVHLDVTGWPAGIYIARVYTEKDVQTKKLLIE